MQTSYHTRTIVTLNSFQGPSLGLRRSGQGEGSGAVALSKWDSARAARWMLKQVQHDELAGGLAA
jgi:hypothetical protein